MIWYLALRGALDPHAGICIEKRDAGLAARAARIKADPPDADPRTAAEKYATRDEAGQQPATQRRVCHGTTSARARQAATRSPRTPRCDTDRRPAVGTWRRESRRRQDRARSPRPAPAHPSGAVYPDATDDKQLPQQSSAAPSTIVPRRALAGSRRR